MNIKTKVRFYLIIGIIFSAMGFICATMNNKVLSILGGILILSGTLLVESYWRQISFLGFIGKVEICFSGYDSCKEIKLPTRGNRLLPSQQEKKKIEKLIEEKKKNFKIEIVDDKIFSPLEALKAINPFFPRSLEQMSLQELEKRLSEIEEIYEEDDLYDFYEVNVNKINISIHNKAKSYIEDASIQIKTKKMDGLKIVNRIINEPTSSIFDFSKLNIKNRKYPFVYELNSYIIIKEEIGIIKHHVPISAFEEPIRIVLLDQLIGEVIILKCAIYGKNLVEPLRENLKIQVIKSQ